jgi:DnaK suppressor protein
MHYTANFKESFMSTPDKLLTDKPVAPETISAYQEEPGEAYMNDNQKKHFEKLLLQTKAQLLDFGKQTLKQLQDDVSASPDISDQASQEEAFRTQLRTHGREYQLIKKIDEALYLLKTSDNYGYCEACGGKIGIQRLEARPTANLCIDCKTLEEIREKQQGN